MGYGRQRVWGTIGFGISAFLAGYAVDYWSKGEIIKTYTPAFLLILIFTVIDLFCCKKLDVSIIIFKIIFLVINNLLKIIFTATINDSVHKYIERCYKTFKIEIYNYISLFHNNCWHS